MTTWWDVYETLLHLLLDQDQIINNQNNNNGSNINYDNDYNLDNSEYYQDRLMNRKNINQPNGHSLFFPIPNRNCKTANIPSYLCSCDLSVDLDINSDIIKQGVSFLIGYINNYLLKDYQKICMKLTLNKIIDAQMYQNKNKYSVIFQTGPNNASFDATFLVSYKKEFNISSAQFSSNSTMGANNQTSENKTSIVEPLLTPKFKLLGNIVRINTYGLSSKCIKVYFLKNYCYCYSFDNLMKHTKKNLA